MTSKRVKHLKQVYKSINTPKAKVIDFFAVEQEDRQLTYKNIGYIEDKTVKHLVR